MIIRVQSWIYCVLRNITRNKRHNIKKKKNLFKLDIHDITKYIVKETNTKAIYMPRRPMLQELSTSTSYERHIVDQEGCASWLPKAFMTIHQTSDDDSQVSENPASRMWIQKWLATAEARESRPDRLPVPSWATRRRPSSSRASEATRHFWSCIGWLHRLYSCRYHRTLLPKS